MSKPKIFVSSIYIDLKEVKATLDDFISHYGYDVAMIEKGGIPYDYDKFTGESCCKEVEKSDLYILIIGGRYFSLAPEEENTIRQKMKKYNLITKSEYKTALDLQLPIYIFIDRMVFSEYTTWKLNKDKNVNYAHVDNNNIFELIKEIYKNGLSEYVNEFSSAKDISSSLREKWAEMFKELLISKKNKTGRRKQRKVPINCYKLFYYRHSKKINIVDMAKLSNIYC